MQAPFIDDLDGLKAALKTLFQTDDLDFTDTGHYGVMFVVPGKTRAIQKALLERTDPAHWDGEAGRLFYRDEARNLLLHLTPVPQHAMCIATVLTLHLQHLEQYRLPPSE